MKYRQGFVSNSSSSSFVIFGKPHKISYSEEYYQSTSNIDEDYYKEIYSNMKQHLLAIFEDLGKSGDVGRVLVILDTLESREYILSLIDKKVKSYDYVEGKREEYILDAFPTVYEYYRVFSSEFVDAADLPKRVQFEVISTEIDYSGYCTSFSAFKKEYKDLFERNLINE